MSIHYEQLFQSMTVGVIVHAADSQIVSANPAAEKLLGLSIDQLQGRKPIDPRWKAIHLDGSDFPGETHPAMVALEKGKMIKDVVMGIFQPELNEHRWIEVDAIPLFKHGRPKPYQVFTTFKDITGQIYTEKQLAKYREELEELVAERTDKLRENERVLSTLISNLPGMVYKCQNDKNWTMEFISDGCETLTGYTPDEIIHDEPINYNQIIHPDDRNMVWDEIQTALENKQPFKIMYRILTKSGRTKWVFEQGQGIYGPNDDVVHIEGYISDATERKEIEDAGKLEQIWLFIQNELLNEISKGLNKRQIINQTVTQLSNFFPRYRITYSILDNEGILKILYSTDPPDMIELQGRTFDLNPAPVYLRAIKEGTTTIIGDITRDHRLGALVAELKEINTLAIMGFPVDHSENIQGILIFGASEPMKWPESEVKLFRDIADFLSLAIKKARAEEKRTEAEKVLGHAKERYQSLFTNLQEGFALLETAYNEKRQIQDLRVLEVNPAFERILGLKRENVIRQNVHDLIENSGENFIQKLITVAVEGQSIHFQYHFEDINRYFEYHAYQPQSGLVGVHFYDITSRKLAENRLQESEKKYRQFFEDDISGIYVSTADGAILECNSTMLELLGYESLDELKKINAFSVYPDPDIRTNMLKTIQKNGKVDRYESEFRTKDGRTVYAVQNAAGYFNDNGELETIKGYVFDVTERRLLEEQLLQAQKLEAVGLLAGGVAHDFNNLLTVILGYCNMLLSIGDLNDPQGKMITQILKAGERASSLTNQLLAFSRKQIIEPKILNINNIIKESEKILRRLIGEDIELSSVYDKHLSKVKADPGQIDQIIMNLAVNARDAMPEGGKLSIETKDIFLEEEYASYHLSVKPGNYVMIAITDNGKGMSPEIQSRIFEPFFTTKGKSKGTGLGLSTVYGIVKQIGGDIWVYSEPGKGTTFKIYLPVITDIEIATEKTVRAPQSVTGTETILIVEDDSALRELAKLTLTGYGYKILEASNGSEALDICKNNSNEIDFLLTDVVLPKMSGKDVADKIAGMCPGIKILFMSGYTDDAIARHGVLEAGINLLQKPFTPPVLAKKVREVLDTEMN
ncbi:MAG: PAS domain S-box protein [Calditrichaceae bacterium]